LLIALLLLGNALAQIQQPTNQMLQLAEIAERHSFANRNSNAWRLGEPMDGKGALSNVIFWMSMKSGYGKIPSGFSRQQTANLMTTAEYDELMAAGPYRFKRLIDIDERTNGAARFGIKRINSNVVPMVKDCPRGAILVMYRGGPSQNPDDLGIYVCSGVGSRVHYNGAVKYLKDVDNSYIGGMYAPSWYNHPVSPLPPPPRPVVQDTSSITGRQPPRPVVTDTSSSMITGRLVQDTSSITGRPPRPVVKDTSSMITGRLVQDTSSITGRSRFVVDTASITGQGWGRSRAITDPENTLPSNSAEDLTPGWAVAFIVIGSVVLVAVIVLVAQLSRTISHA